MFKWTYLVDFTPNNLDLKGGGLYFREPNEFILAQKFIVVYQNKLKRGF
jgi:hypothetical protein